LGQQDRWSVVAIEFVSSAGLLIWLVKQQLANPTPVLPLDLLRIPIVRFSGLTSLCSYVVQGMSFITLPFYFRDVQHFSLAEVGWAMTPWPLAVAVSSNIAGRLSDRLSAGTIGTVGLAGLVLGLASLAFMPADLHAIGVFWRMALCGFAFGLFVVPNSRAIMANVPAHRSGGAAAVQSSGRIFGQSVGAALVAAVFGLAPAHGPESAMIVALGFSVLACCVSALRLKEAPA
jgi:DHA2 family multidrug resistance protein-like MFS transporter